VVGLVENGPHLRIPTGAVGADGQPGATMGGQDRHQPVHRRLDPPAQRPRRQVEATGFRDEHDRPHDVEVELSFGAEVVVDQASGHSRVGGHRRHLHRGIRLFTERPDSRGQDGGAPLIRAEPSPPRFGGRLR